jgi:hypothetical protein
MEINLICHLLSFTDMLPCRRSKECKWLFMYSLVRDITSVFQLDFGIFRTNSLKDTFCISVSLRRVICLSQWFIMLCSDSARHRSRDICPSISQIILKKFIIISLIIKDCPEEILIRLAIVLKIPKSSWNTDVMSLTKLYIKNHLHSSDLLHGNISVKESKWQIRLISILGS